MLRTDINWPDHRKFKSNTEYEPLEFFSECLRNSKRFDFFLGFFSSSAIQLLSDSFATFIHGGGKLRLIINNVLSEDDKTALLKAEDLLIDDIINIDNLLELRETLSKRDKHFFECLSWLVANNRIEIRVIKPKGKSGIAHYKEGIFYDETDTVSFTGSCNFSKNALLENLETITSICNWDKGPSVVSITETIQTFNTTFQYKNKDVDYLNANDIISSIEKAFGQKEIVDLLSQEQDLIQEHLCDAEIVTNNRIRQILNKARQQTNFLIQKELEKNEHPCFPFPQGPREYQKIAFENWKNNGQKGLFAMATGTGKTITALNCLLEIYKRNGYYKAIILVPTITLVNQWEKECRKFLFSNIIKVYSKNLSWKEELERIHFIERYRSENEPEVSFIIISTYASYSRDKVFHILNDFDRRKLLVIADECHNMGAQSLVKRLKDIPYLRRIGLSATPDRQFDITGNTKLKKFFGSEEKYTYEYSMKEAIQNGVLCRYMYYPHLIRLTSDEMDAYVELSEKISKYFNYNTCMFDAPDEMLKRLLLARKRIIHKAANKLPVFIDIIEKLYKKKGHLKYSLIYVPEGNKPDYVEGPDDFDKSEVIKDDTDADHLINIYTQAVTEVDERVTVRKFTSGQKDREEILNDFSNGKLHVLTSMKCLDEGVDVPRSELAIFCSSTGNPRQFIQRRGRVLRTHPNKSMAELHDLVVIPEVSPNSKSYRMEQALLKGELLRVNNFALLSENPSYSEMELREVIDYYGLNLYNNTHIQ